MMLAAAKGTEVTIEADGTDEADALDAVEALIKDRFGENEWVFRCKALVSLVASLLETSILLTKKA